MRIDDDTLDIIESCEINDTLLTTTCGQMDRKQYVKFNKVIELCGGKWNRKLKGHVFDSDPSDLIETVVRSKEVIDTKKLYQAYFTPENLAHYVVDLCDIHEDDMVLEPSLGSGNIGILIPGIVHFCEIQPDLVEQAINEREGFVHVGNDFLEYHPGPIYDRIVANPPFTKGQDVEHVSHMIDCCKEGGTIVSIMSPGITFKTDKKTKALLEKMDGCESHMIESVDAGSFKESGTMVNAIIVKIVK